MQQQSRDYAQTAIAALERMLDDKSTSHADLAKAVRCVVALRNCLIEEHRRGHDSPECLASVNSLLSLAFGAEYPLTGFHRNRIEMTRDRLVELYGR